MNLTKLLELALIAGEGISENKESLNAYAEMIATIKQAMLEQETSKAGGNKEKNRLKAAQTYIQKAIKDHGDKKDTFGGCTYQKEKQWLVNGYSCVGLIKPITGLPEVEKPMTFGNLIPDYNNEYSDYRQIDYKLDIPALKTQLKEATAEEKASNKKEYKSEKRYFQVGDQWFLVDLFLNTLAIIPGKYTYYQVYEEVKTHCYGVRPLMIENENKDIAMILPIKRSREEENNQQSA